MPIAPVSAARSLGSPPISVAASCARDRSRPLPGALARPFPVPPTPETGGFQWPPQVPSPQPAIPSRNSGNGLNGETSATRDPADPGGDSTDGPRSRRVRIRRHPIRHGRSGRSNGPVQSGSTAGHHGGHFSDAVCGGPSGSPVLGQRLSRSGGLRWWLHPQGCGRQLEVRGDRVELTWVVQSGSVGHRAYGVWHPQPAGTDVGVGMAADSRYHRHRGPDEEVYDGWVVFYYRVQPIPPDAGTRGRRRANQLGRQWATSRAPSTSVG